MRILDLFSCAGGAGRGYADAGFTVTGVDLHPQPRYPFHFTQRSALDLDPAWIGENFEAVHASPPCQFATPLRHAPNGKDHYNFIPETRALLKATGLPYIIENVEAAREHLINPIMLCGSMFGLGAGGHQLQRHRLFESNVALQAPYFCQHTEQPVIGVYGGHVRCRSSKHGGRGTVDFVGQDKVSLAKEAMGMDWATMGQMSEAIPPAYTEHLGRQLMQYLIKERQV